MTNLLQTPSGYFTGWKASPLDPRNKVTEVDVAQAFPDTYDTRGSADIPPIVNQLELGSCTANATTRAIRHEFIKAGDDPGNFSRLWAYAQTRYMEGGWAQFAEDSGAFGHDDLKLARHGGLILEDLWDYDNYKTTFNDKELFDGLKTSVPNSQRYFIDSYSHPTPVLDNFKRVLAGDKFIVFGFSVYESFESQATAESGIVQVPQRGERILGGHEIAIEGYTLINGKDYFIVANNWGTEWGDKGYCYFPPEYMFGYGTSDWRVVDSVKTTQGGE